MRTEREIFDLILQVAEKDERIRAAVMVGSRANPAIPKDKFMDYDICYYVHDVEPFFNNFDWLYEKFGKPAVMQLPESNTLPCLPPEGDGHCTFLMIFEDNVRIDLSVDNRKYIDDGEPAIVLLDKDNGSGFVPKMSERSDKFWHIKPPTKSYFFDCCNEFWWCLNNVGKGIARRELPYAMRMYNVYVRDMLNMMLEWCIGIDYDFAVSAGKDGKFFRKLLPPEMYEKYAKTYSGGDYENFWNAVFTMCGLFREAAQKAAEFLGAEYNQAEEDSMIKYLNFCKAEKD